ncbi:hypothetical protein [Streptomyces sp. CB01881]|uniref:hypothetical protein n=1 Tax=Streptomyces sp. CB01881 TaxID=2078691 RepID=UPI000CDBD6DC|nr:hypothetical protein [Streptomyces sp. CB01881]AUY54088.1 hypothetical protein C2142_09350 [Streptomyces sp. CB01881]TYC77946.1 hypothetical protein EH183_09350 [Streptomyces sp. CB01881]
MIAATGAALCVLGWYGVSGEQFAEQQIPYLASSTIPGAALIVAGVVLVALRSSGRSPGSSDRSADLTHRRVERLYALLVEPDDGPGDSSPGDSSPGGDGPGDSSPGDGASAAETAAVTLAVPEGTLYHRPHCPLVTGKPRAVPVDAAAVRARGLAPCRLCEPGPPGGADPPEGPAGPARPGDAAPPAG